MITKGNFLKAVHIYIEREAQTAAAQGMSNVSAGVTLWVRLHATIDFN